MIQRQVSPAGSGKRGLGGPERPRRNLKLIQKHKLTVGRFTVPYAITGNGGTPIFAVNGAQQTMASWFSFLKHFARRPEFKLVLLDFPGQGRARINAGSPEVNLEEHLAVLRAVTEAVAPEEEIHLIGGSWGAVVAAAYAARFPKHVSKLILGSFRTNPNAALKKILATGQALFEEQRLEEIAALLIDGFGAHLSQSMKAKMRQQFAVMSLDHLRNLYAQTFVFQSCRDISEHVDLGAIQAETLIVNGAKDPIVDPEDTRVAASRIPRGRFRLLPNVGHFLHVENPEVLEVYEAFLLGE